MSKSNQLYRACIFAGCALLILRLLPVVLSLIISASSGKNLRGVLRYFFQWKGLENYISLFTQRETSYYSSFPYIFSDNYFFRALKNSFLLALSSGGLAALVSGLLAACALRLPKKWQTVILCAAAIPAVIPEPCTVSIVIDLCSSDGAVTSLLLKAGLLTSPKNLFSIPLTYSIIYPLMETVKMLFFPTSLAIIMGKQYGKKGVFCAAALYCLLRLVLFAGFSSAGKLMSNPLIYNTADTLGLFAYRKGVMEMMYNEGSSIGAALDILRWLLTMAAAVPATILVHRMLRSLKSCRPERFTGSTVPFMVGTFVLLLPSLLTTGSILYKGIHGIAVLFPELERWGVVKHEYLFNAMLNYLPGFANSLLICGSSGAVAAGAALCISIALRHKSLRPLAFVAFCWPAGSSALYWLLKQTEILNSYPGVFTGQVLFWGFPILGGVVLYLYMKRYDYKDMKQYFRLSRPMLWAVFATVSLFVYSLPTGELARGYAYSAAYSLFDFVEGSGQWLRRLNDFSGGSIEGDAFNICYAATRWIMAMLLCLPPSALACTAIKKLRFRYESIEN